MHKGAVLQHSGPGRAFKGLGVAKRYCSNDSMGESFVQRQDQVKYFEALVCGSDMVTEQTRNYVWQELLDAARLVRYYEALSDRHRRNHSRVRFLLLAAATGSIAALLDLIPESTQLFTSAWVALLVAWDFVSDYAKKAAVLHTISLECSALEIEF